MFILNENFLTITEYNNWLTSLWNYPPTNVARKFICSKMKTSVLGNIWWYNSLFNNLKLLIQSESSSVDIFTLTKTKYLLINLKNTCLQKQKINGTCFPSMPRQTQMQDMCCNQTEHMEDPYCYVVSSR